jgi:hypothetical protein
MAYPLRPSQSYVQANHPYYPPNPYYQHLLQDPWFQPSPELVPGPLPPSPPVSQIPGQHPSGNTGWQPPSIRTVQYAPEQPAPQDLFAPPTIAPPAPAQAAPAVPTVQQQSGPVPVDNNLRTDTLEGMTEQALAGLAAAQTAAAQVGLSELNILGANDPDGSAHLSHQHGTEFDISGVNADGSLWTDDQRVAVATAVAQTGGDRFGFYTGPSRSLHMGYSGAAGPAAAWGPGGRVRGVSLDSFSPVERAFVEALRTGTLGQLVANSPLGIIAAGPRSPAEVVTALQTTLNQAGANIAVDGAWGPQTEQALAAFQGQQQQDTAAVLAATEAFSPTAPMIAPQMTEAAVSPNLVADALPVSPATDRAYAPPSSGLPQAAQAIQDASPVLPAMEGAVLDIAPVAPPMAAERPMPNVLNPAADYGIGIPSAPQPQELQPLASYDLDIYDPNVPIEQQIAPGGRPTPQSNPDQRIAQTFEHSFPMQPVEQTAALPANPAPPEAMAAPFGQIMQGPFETALPGGAPPEATAALPAPAASQLTPDVRVEQGFGFEPQPIADWELVERAFLAGHPNSILQPDQAPPVDMPPSGPPPAPVSPDHTPYDTLTAQDFTQALSPLQPQTDFGFVPDYQTIATSPAPQVAAPVAPDMTAALSVPPDMTAALSPAPTLAAPVPPSAIDAPYLGGYELPSPLSPAYDPLSSIAVPSAPLSPSPPMPVPTTSFAPESIPFQPDVFTPPTMQFEEPYAPPAPAAPVMAAAPPAPSIPTIAQPSPAVPTIAQPSAPSIPTVQAPEATEPPTPLSLDAIASQAGFGATGLPSINAPPMARGFGAPLGWGDLGRAGLGFLTGGPIGAIAAPIASRAIGSVQNLIQQPRPMSPPRPIFNPFNPGQIIGYDTSGQDGGDGYGGNTYGSGGFTGSYPGMGHFSGPNPGPNDPNYGYA